jgi:hypothetical protein
MRAAIGYGREDYVATLSEFGTPLSLPASGGSLLVRPVIDGLYDAMHPYPLFSCGEWAQLDSDLAGLASRLVSVVVVADPLSAPDDAVLRRAFPDLVVAYKPHAVVELATGPSPARHHRRRIRSALRAVEVEICDRPLAALAEWTSLYAELVERHSITGIQTFSARCFEALLRLPGILALRARRGDRTVAMTIWLLDGPCAWYHLGASSDEGYEVGASYALFEAAFDELRARQVEIVDLGGSSGRGEADGLLRFKTGWATGERVARLCGRILDPVSYRRLGCAAGTRRGGTAWFPEYRVPGGAFGP